MSRLKVWDAGAAAWQYVTAGAARLTELFDVSVSSPADGEVLTYDSGTSKWKNEAGGGGSLPAWFQSGAGSPVDALTPAQAGAVYFDTTSGGIYSAIGATDEDWIAIGGIGNAGAATGLVFLDRGIYFMAGDRDDPSTSAYVGSAYAQWNGHGQGLLLNFGAAEGLELFVLKAGATGEFVATLLDGLGQTVLPGKTTVEGPLVVASLVANPADLQNSQAALWFNDNNGAPFLEITAKTANGTVVTGQLELAP